jgi:hypothetical protein
MNTWIWVVSSIERNRPSGAEARTHCQAFCGTNEFVPFQNGSKLTYSLDLDSCSDYAGRGQGYLQTW